MCQEEGTLTSEIVLASAYSVYMGPYNTQFRKQMVVKHWTKCLKDRGMKLEVNMKSDLLLSAVCSRPRKGEIDLYKKTGDVKSFLLFLGICIIVFCYPERLVRSLIYLPACATLC